MNFRKALLFLLAIMLTLPQISSAQAPGYLGKKMQVYYGFNISPAFTGANYNDRLWNQQHELSFQYSFGMSWQTGISARLFNTIYDNKRYIDAEGTPPKSYYKLRGAGVMWTFRHFKNKYVAPWGKYFEFGLVVNVVNTKYDAYMNIRKQVNNHDTLLHNFGPEVQLYITPDILFGWGKTRILKNKFIIDYGWNACLLALFGTVSDVVKANNTVFTFDNYISETYQERVHGLNRFNLYLRFGYLF